MSLGLGGNTASALNQFLFQGESYTKAGDKNTSGNGSIMRLSPLAIWFACYCCETGTFNSDIDTALRVARQSSYATHQGNDAAECCALLMMFLVRAIQTGDKLLCFEEIKEFFKTANPRVQCIARSEREDKENDWNWKNKHFKYAEGRVKENPGYVGSYSCDALAMAFHCIWWTNNFHDALIKAVNYRGDADSVGAITGQIAGAIYGFLEIPKEWLDELLIWDDCHIGIRCMILEKRAKRLRQRLYKKKS
jgi:ADP-ribosylglycohydrolase